MPVSSQTASPSKSRSWHKKIAKNRGESWHKNMLAGRRDAVLNPSNIRLLRMRGNVYQDVIAKKLGMSESTFGAVERGKRMVSTEAAKAIAAYLSVDVKKIFKFVRHGKYIAIIVKTAI